MKGVSGAGGGDGLGGGCGGGEGGRKPTGMYVSVLSTWVQELGVSERFRVQ